MNWLVIISVLVILIVLIVSLYFAGLGERFKKNKSGQTLDKKASNIVKDDVNRIFDNEFREELRNRGRLHFEKIISENAMFLQQDLRLTTSQLNDYLKDEIKKVLKEEFAKYEESIKIAKDLALKSIEQTNQAIEQQRIILEKQLKDQTELEKKQIIDRFEKSMASIVNHYLLLAIGNEIDLTSQLDFILQNLEDNKQAIIEDIKNGS